MTKGRIWIFLAGVVLGVAGGVAGRSLYGPAANPQEAALLASLYVQTAAEYRACCLQTYAWASERLAEKLKARAGEKQPAVVLDLDETVLDNSPFQTFLDRERLPYSDRYWEDWEENYPDEVDVIPGAREFITEAQKKGVIVVYISNRLEKYKTSTVRALKSLGIATEGIEDHLLLRGDGAPSDKTARRKQAEERYDVLLYVGDSLRDFSEEFAARPKEDGEAQKNAIEERNRKVDANRRRWGVDWFVLPNPVYGEWQNLLGNDPRSKMRPTTMRRP
jgi:acid phosphatase